MAELFKFRCYQCEKLLGVPDSKLGARIKCPRCGAELIVPSPDDDETPPPGAPEGDGIRLEDLGLRLEPGPVAPAAVDPLVPDPIAFLQRAAEPDPEPAEFDPDPGPTGLPEPPDPLEAPLVPGRKRRGRSSLVEETARRRDVVLPRTAAVAWSLFGLLALGFAFTAGLMIGHFLWK